MSSDEARRIIDAAQEVALGRLVTTALEEVRAMRTDIEQGNKAANHETVEIVAGLGKRIHETNAYLMGQILDIKQALDNEQKERPARQRDVDAKMEKITDRQHALELKAVTVAGSVIFALVVIAAGVAYLVLR